MDDLKFDLDDIVLIPAEESSIESRSECSVISKFNEMNTLPLIASPMDTVVSIENYNDFLKNGIIPCLPRGTQLSSVYKILKEHMFFQSFGLSEIEHELKFDCTNDLSSFRKFEKKVMFYYLFLFALSLISSNKIHY